MSSVPGSFPGRLQPKLSHNASLLDFDYRFNDAGFDNGPAIRQGLAQAGTLLIPAGQKSNGTPLTINVATPITLTSGMRLGSEQQHDRWRSAQNGGMMPVLNYVGTGAAFKIVATDIAHSYDSISLEGMTVDGRAATGAVDGLLMDATAAGAFIESFRAHRVTFRNFPRHQVYIRGTVFDFMFHECSFNNQINGVAHPVTGDLVFVQFVNPFPASSQSRFSNCFGAIYTPGFWAYRIESSGVSFSDGIIEINPIGGLGLFAKFGLNLVGTHIEGDVPTDTTSVGVRYSGQNGGIFFPLNCSGCGTGLQVGDPTSPSDPATGLQIGAGIGFNNVAAGGVDIRIVGGGDRQGTSINVGNDPAGAATIVDERDAGLVISGATNALPIEITTSTNHPYITGDQIFQWNVGGNLAANGLFLINVTAPNKYTLLHLDSTPVAGTGAYTSGGSARIYCPDVQLQINKKATQVVRPQIRGKVTHNLTNQDELSYNLGADANDGFRIRSRQNALKLVAQLLNNGGNAGELDLYDNAEIQGVLLRGLVSSQFLYPVTIGKMAEPATLLDLYATQGGTFGMRLLDKATGFIVGQLLTTAFGGEFSLYDGAQHQTLLLSGGESLLIAVKDTLNNILASIDPTGAAVLANLLVTSTIASRPLKTDTFKNVVSGKIDLGVANDIAASGISTGHFPLWNGTLFTDGGVGLTTTINTGTTPHLTVVNGLITAAS